jgi:hypothetical protein
MTLHLDLLDGTTFTTHDAIDDGQTWNGFPSPLLPIWQAYLVGLLVDEPLSTWTYPERMKHLYDLGYVRVDGLTWYESCPDCGMPHTDEHSCEPLPMRYE